MEKNTYVQYFEDMIEYLKLYDLTVNEFKTYYLRLSHAIEMNYIKNPLKYIFALLNTRVKSILTKNEEEYYAFIKMRLLILMKKFFENDNMNEFLDDYYETEFAKMEQIIPLNKISFEMFDDYYFLVNISLIVPTKRINSTKAANLVRLLLNANVEVLTHKEHERLIQMKAKLEKKYHSFSNGELTVPKTK